MTEQLEFEAEGDWNLQGSNKKDFYISFVTKIDGWKKSVVFYRDKVDSKVFNFLLQQIMEGKPEKNWKFLVIRSGGYMNSIRVSQLLRIENEQGNIIFTESG